jgi:hypothetical protein
MTSEVAEVHLLDVARGEPVAAELWHAITEEQLADWEGEWVPELFRAMQRLRRAGVERAHWPQSRHWDWRRKVAALQGMLANPGFGIVCGGLTQGMMIVDAVKHRGRLDVQQGQHLVYVEFIENAPWNRAELFDPPRYRGVGSILIRAAVALSEELEFHGRIGLHSLPQANGFYADTCRMTDLGADPDYEGLRYFEMTPEGARAFIAKGRSK